MIRIKVSPLWRREWFIIYRKKVKFRTQTWVLNLASLVMTSTINSFLQTFWQFCEFLAFSYAISKRTKMLKSNVFQQGIQKFVTSYWPMLRCSKSQKMLTLPEIYESLWKHKKCIKSTFWNMKSAPSFHILD